MKQNAAYIMALKHDFIYRERKKKKERKWQICLYEIRLSEQNIIHGNPFLKCFVVPRR